MKPLNEMPWIGTHRGKGDEGDLYIRGEDLSTLKHYKMERAGMKVRGWPEIGPDGSVLLTPYIP
jgi:hypothetical protein